MPDDMGRRRHQNQSVKERGEKVKYWSLRYRIYNQDGSYTYKRETLGYKPTTTDPDKMRERGEITKREAQRKAEIIMAAVNGRAAAALEDPTLGDFVAFHWPRHTATLGAGTARKYASHVKTIVEALGKRKLSKITAAHVQDMVNAQTTGWHMKTDLRMVVSAMFTRASAWGLYTGRNPAKDVYCGRKKLARDRVILSPEQVKALVASLPEPSRSLALLLDASGMRVSEALGLQEKHLDYPEKGFAMVAQRWSRGDLDETKTERSRRVVALGGWTPLALAGDPERFVFDRGDGLPHDDRQLAKDQLRPALKRLGFWVPGLGWHSFRRKFATETQAAGASSIETAKALGHARTSMTGEYTVLQPERLREIADKRRTVH